MPIPRVYIVLQNVDIDFPVHNIGIFAFMSRIKIHNLLIKQACAFLLVILPIFL